MTLALRRWRSILRACAVLGDRTTTGGTIITAGAGSFMTIDGKAAALWGDIATCPACKSTGKITGETFPIQTVNGVPVARHNDLVLCKCPKKPRLIAPGVNMVADEVHGASGTGNVSEAAGLMAFAAQAFDQRAQLLDAETQQPIAGKRYRMTWSGGTIEGITSASGHTMPVRSDQAETAEIHILTDEEK
ncbi:PAAR domain-containing protein [Ralstonia pseudosolanacearum]|uniref:PAAR domain-containing protein n=1 Tax=Ralstonia pseudosolanacearum TaxID=1310165 RepID=UPI002674A8C7|nr:PAAR domain-containing protein [Ralstonia pseudosolanacearum]MDO3620786.1 PAAR domain-containing protein [Ralstonia pseudosolanacearum]